MLSVSVRAASLRLAFAVFVVAPAVVAAQAPLTVERIFSGEFRSDYVGPSRWLDDSTYTIVAPTAGGQAADLVRVDAATGRRSVLIPASKLVPAGRQGAARGRGLRLVGRSISGCSSSPTPRASGAGTRAATSGCSTSRPVKLRKLGGPSAKPSTLQFAKFSPDGKRVAYVREHNLYVESLADGTITPLTKDGSKTIINGTFDWVYEEELSLRDGFRWSPDGQRIAYWQLDASGVRDFLLINNTDSLYSFTVPVQYPKAGTTNSAARIGVVSASGGPTTWMKIPGDPRNNYLARMDWAANSTELTIQQLNRRQTVNTMFIANAKSGRGAAALRRARQRLDRHLRRPQRLGPGSVAALAGRRLGVRLPERARRMAARLPRVARRHDATHHARQVRRDESLIHRYQGRLALFLRVAGERHADVPLAHPARREASRSASPPRRRAGTTNTTLARARDLPSTRRRRGARRRSSTSCGCPRTRSCARSSTITSSSPSSRDWRRDRSSSRRSTSATA